MLAETARVLQPDERILFYGVHPCFNGPHVEFRYDTIATSAEFRNRAAQSLSLFLTVTVTGALITVSQPLQALGVELFLVGIGSAALLETLDSAARSGQSGRTNPALLVALSIFFGCIATTGVLLVLGWRAGLYFYVAAAILGLVWGVYGAWICDAQVQSQSCRNVSAST